MEPISLIDKVNKWFEDHFPGFSYEYNVRSYKLPYTAGEISNHIWMLTTPCFMINLDYNTFTTTFSGLVIVKCYDEHKNLGLDKVGFIHATLEDVDMLVCNYLKDRERNFVAIDCPDNRETKYINFNHDWDSDITYVETDATGEEVEHSCLLANCSIENIDLDIVDNVIEDMKEGSCHCRANDSFAIKFMNDIIENP